MKYCFHYQYDKEANKYVSLAIRYVGNKNPNKVHCYKCKRCGLPLHTIDVININKKLDDMNNKLSGDNKNFPFLDLSDIHQMMAPVPYVYDEDSKYRDNQLR